MKELDKIWKDIDSAIEQYNKLGIGETVDYNKFYLYSIINHSTAIEGSTLTELDTQLLLDEGITAKGKPLVDHLMNSDLRDAYVFAIEEAKKKRDITPDFLIQLNAKVMKSVGGVNHMSGGTFDSSKGEFRKCGVTAGYEGRSYLNYMKIEHYINDFCLEMNKRLKTVKTTKDIYNLSFDAHLNLVTIHPWLDGNGRTARLLMNYIQFYFNLVPVNIKKEDKGKYIASLIESQETESSIPFYLFMAEQHVSALKKEIENYKKNSSKDFNFMFFC